MAKQDDYIKTALRIPKSLHARLTAQADSKGRSLNAEFISSLDGAAEFDFPPDLKLRLEAEAEKAGRPYNSEVVERLAGSLERDPQRDQKVIELQTRLINTLASHLKNVAEIAKPGNPSRAEQLDFIIDLAESLRTGDYATSATLASEMFEWAKAREANK